jgi:hypothetical protein
MVVDASFAKLKMPKPAWYQATAECEHSNLRKSRWQLVDTFVPYCLLWALMIHTIQQGYPHWRTLVMALVAGSIPYAFSSYSANAVIIFVQHLRNAIRTFKSTGKEDAALPTSAARLAGAAYPAFLRSSSRISRRRSFPTFDFGSISLNSI